MKNRIIYARITALTLDELPLESIEGKITSGSLNIDGNSAVRRTCSLTMLSDVVDINNYLWSYKTKFKLEIGVADPNSSTDITWYKQGIFIITNFTSVLSVSGYTINIQGKDKMCLLNGEVGGAMLNETVLDSIDIEETDGSYTRYKFPIKQIIRDSVHQYANEPLHNIIINDLDDLGLELLEYRYDEPFFLIRHVDNDVYDNGTFDKNTWCHIEGQPNPSIISDGTIVYDTLIELVNQDMGFKPTKVKIDGDNNYHCLARIDYGETAGYRATELTYPNDLILKVGEALTIGLDKIKTMLGDFEYFYDINGQFIFQKKPNSMSTVWTQVTHSYQPGENDFIEGQPTGEWTFTIDAEVSPYAYKFQGTNLISAFSNAPNINNLKNDYTVWGQRDSVSDGANIPIHMRLAIDSKPVLYNTIDGISFINDKCKQNPEEYAKVRAAAYSHYYEVDWREIIYQMGKEWRAHQNKEDVDSFEIKLAANNPQYFSTGRTGYEQYYTDLEGFWRELYYPEYAKTETREKIAQSIAKKEDELSKTPTTNAKYKTIEEELQLLKDNQVKVEEQLEIFTPWTELAVNDPARLNFWFDFIDSPGSEINQFSVKAVGCRPKAINETKVKSIYFRETPAIIFGEKPLDPASQKPGYRYFQMPNMNNLFTISAQGLSAKDKIDELLYQHSYATESITMTAIPVYDLEPNTCIYVNDEKTGIAGDYLVSKISIPLSYSGLMSITATKAPLPLK